MAPAGVEEADFPALSGDAEPARGVWLFAGPSRQMAAARAQLENVSGVEVVSVSASVVLVRSEMPLASRSLVEQAAALREAWLRVTPGDTEAQRLRRWARTALAGS